MPIQVFVSELNKYIREHKPPNMTLGMRWEDKTESNDSTIEPGKDWHAMFTAFNLYNYIHVYTHYIHKQNNMHLQDAPIITLETIASLHGCLLSGDTTISHTVFANHV